MGHTVKWVDACPPGPVSLDLMEMRGAPLGGQGHPRIRFRREEGPRWRRVDQHHLPGPLSVLRLGDKHGPDACRSLWSLRGAHSPGSRRSCQDCPPCAFRGLSACRETHQARPHARPTSSAGQALMISPRDPRSKPGHVPGFLFSGAAGGPASTGEDPEVIRAAWGPSFNRRGSRSNQGKNLYRRGF